MASRNDIERFLADFNVKLGVFDILFLDSRDKNREALRRLNISPNARIEVLKGLKPDDYVQGPIVDALNAFGDMWVFGKDMQGREVYIKIAMGASCAPVICVSFHEAEHPLSYPLKDN